MRYIFIFTEKEFGLSEVKKAIEKHTNHMFRGEGSDCLLVHSYFPAKDDSFFTSDKFHERVQFEVTEYDFEEDLEKEEKELVSSLGQPNVYILKWGSDEFLLGVLEILSRETSYVVDDEQTVLRKCPEFLQYISESPEAHIG